MPKARLYFDGDNTGIEKEAREYSLTQAVEDKLDSIDTIETTLQGEIDDLQDQIDNLASRGRYLSTWDCVSGLPDTNPQTDPYVYRAGDYYIVSTVGGTNYRPNGSEYHIGVASQVVESLPVSQNDLYIYDGIQWILQQSGSSLNAVWGSITGTLSAQTDLQNALNTKANAVDLNTKTFPLSGNSGQTALDEAQAIFDYWNSGKNPIVKYGDTQYYVSRLTDNGTNKFLIFASLNETLYNSVEEGMPKLIIRASSSTDIVNSIDDSGHFRTGVIYTAGDNIKISSGNIISTVGLQKKLVAGDNITIQDVCHPNIQGPCPDGFHIPSGTEVESIIDTATAFSLTAAELQEYMYIPIMGTFNVSGSFYSTNTMYWSYYINPGATNNSRVAEIADIYYNKNFRTKGHGLAIRPFANTVVVPSGTDWVQVYDGSSVVAGAGIWHNATDGLLSYNYDGATRYTTSDKNLGATTVYNYGDALTAANCGNYYQWGNNHGFPYGSALTTSSTQVDASDYGPGNYYNDGTFITSTDWSSVRNDNLWGGQAPSGTWCEPEISSSSDVISGDAGTTYTIKVANADPASGTPATTITFVL